MNAITRSIASISIYLNEQLSEDDSESEREPARVAQHNPIY